MIFERSPGSGGQDVGRVPEEEVCVQAALHLPPRPRHRLRPDGGRQLALLQQVHRETDCKY